MSIKLGSNIASLTAQRRLGEADSALSRTFERLSSGQRISRASDDAAGLAIADDLKTKGRIYSQSIRNGNDGISLLNIADSAIDALTSVVERIRELSEQAANGTYSSEQRAALDAEAQALSKEFTRITQTTSFNGIKLFDGSLGQGVRLQLGIGISESINASLGGAVGTGGFAVQSTLDAESSNSFAVELGDLNGDGLLDIITAGLSDSVDGYATVRLGTGNGSFSNATSFSTESTLSADLTLGDLNGDGILDLVTVGNSSPGDGYATIRLGIGDGSFGAATFYSTESQTSNSVCLGDLNNDGVLDLVSAGSSDSADGYATVRLGNGDGTFGVSVSYSTENNTSYKVRLGDLNNDGILDLVTAGLNNQGSVDGFATVRLGIGDGSFGVATSYSTESQSSYALSLGDLNSDGNLDLITAGLNDSGLGYFTVRLGAGDGSFSAPTSFSTGMGFSSSLCLGDLNGDGILDLAISGLNGSYPDYDGYLLIKIGRGDGSFESSDPSKIIGNTDGLSNLRDVAIGDINGDGVNDIVSAGYLSDGAYTFTYSGKTSILFGQTQEGLGALLEFSLKTKSDALQSIGLLDRTLENLAKQRGTIGASQSRVNIAISNLQSAKENFAAAESRIRDADIASEAANLIRTQILQQAAASVLSQANQQPQIALQLLR